MDDNLSVGVGWHGHDWAEPKARLVKVATGFSVVQRHCARCHRDFIFTPSSERNAVFVSMISFFLLDEEVTTRWVNLPCPGTRLPSDDDDRKSRIAELVVFHTSETVMALQNRHQSRERGPFFVEDAATEKVKALVLHSPLSNAHHTPRSAAHHATARQLIHANAPKHHRW